MAARTSAADVAVIGGGILGTATAAFLAEAGLAVRLYERTGIAAGASGRNSGILQQPFDPVLADLYRRSLDEYRALAASGIGELSVPAEPSGLLYVGRDPERARQTAAAWAHAWPTSRPEVLIGPVLRDLEPALAPDLAACRLAIGYPVEPAAATRAFAARAEAAGVEVVVGREAVPAIAAGRATGVSSAGSVEPSGAVVVAAGPWTPGVVDSSRAWAPMVASWGVVVSIALADAPRHGLESIDIDIEPAEASADEPAPVAASEGDVDFSLIPADGSSALGSTFLADEPVPRDWVDRLRRIGARYVPGVADAPVVGLRHCARPVSLDGRPLVGEAPWCTGLWIAAGHGPWGISTGPGTARLLADAMLGRRTDLPPALAVDRFGAPAAVS